MTEISITTSLTTDQLWTITWALRDRYLATEKNRDLCRDLANRPPLVVDGETVGPGPEVYSQRAEEACKLLAEIEAIIGQLPESMQTGWAMRLAEHRAEQNASAA